MDGSGFNKRVLVVTREPRALGIAKLPRALARAGFSVAALRRDNSFVARTRYVSKHYASPTNSVRLVATLIYALRDWDPVLVIPGDLWSLKYLHHVATSRLYQLLFPQAVELLRYSLGCPEFYGELDSKIRLQQLATKIGISTLPGCEVHSIDDALTFGKTNGYPVVLKKDHGSGGAGVWICKDKHSLLDTYAEIQKKQKRASVLRTLRSCYKRGLLGHIGKVPVRIAIQKYVEGEPVACNFVALEGRILASNTVFKRLPHPAPTSPCCVIESLQHDQIDSISKALIKQTEFSGFGAFDFIVDGKSGQAYLLECNPVPTSVSHLGDVLGNDLCAALFAVICGNQTRERVVSPQKVVVAMFPHEVRRDPNSRYIKDYYHDIPVDDPALLEALKSHYGIILQ